MRKRNPVRTPERPVSRYQMRQRRRIVDDALRPAVSLALSKLQIIFPVQSAKRRLFRTAPFLKTPSRFHCKLQIVICERSCRMAKTLTVNITPFLKKESRKTKKNEKNIHFPVVFHKKDRKTRVPVKSGQVQRVVQSEGECGSRPRMAQAVCRRDQYPQETISQPPPSSRASHHW